MARSNSKDHPPSVANNILSAKDATTFKTLMDLFNLKQFKRAMKMADSLASKYPRHGEIHSMRALLLMHTDPTKADQIIELAKQGIKYDIKSYLCWHVLGVIYKSKRHYKDAIKSFGMALRFDPKNDRLIKDLCCLCIEIEDYTSFNKYCSNLLQVRSRHYREWMMFAFCQHLCGNLELACSVLEEADVLFKDEYRVEDFELSEAMLYMALIYEESGKYEKCIAHLDEKQHLIKDTQMLLEHKGKAALLLNERALANACYSNLLKINPDNARYLLLYLATHADPDIAGLFYLPKYGHVPPVKADNGKASAGDENDIKPKGYVTINEIEGALKRLVITTNDKSDETAGAGSHGENGKRLLVKNTPILLSNELLDIDGTYSAGGWTTENIGHVFDELVMLREQQCLKENTLPVDVDTNEIKIERTNRKLLENCRTFREYAKRVSVLYDLKDLPNPETIDINEALQIIDNYYKSRPKIYVSYLRQRKISKRAKYPMFWMLKQPTSEQYEILTRAFLEIDLLDTFLHRCLSMAFSRDETFLLGAIQLVEALGEKGAMNTVKYFTCMCTFEKAYLLLVVLNHYSRELLQDCSMDSLEHNYPDEPGTKEEEKQGDDIMAQQKACYRYKLVLILVFMARLYDFLGNQEAAKETINKAIKVAPTHVDVYIVRGKIHKHAGDFESSKNDYCMANDLDKSDRQASAKSAYALLRAYDFDSGRAKWKRFLVEDDCTTRDRTSGDAAPGHDRDPQMDLASFNFELMFGFAYKSLLCEAIIEKNLKAVILNKTGEEWLHGWLNVCAGVLENLHEIYNDQLDFHNYCLNRLGYRTYFHFLKLRKIYCCQGYYIKAVKGVLGGCALLASSRIHHDFLFPTCNLPATSGLMHHEQYARELVKNVNTQPVGDAGLHLLIYRLASIYNWGLMVKVASVLRAFESCRKNVLHYNVYPMVFDLLYTTQDEKINALEAQVLVEAVVILLAPLGKRSPLTIDLIAKKVKDMDGNVLELQSAATIFLQYVRANIDMNFSSLKHMRALLQCISRVQGLESILQDILNTPIDLKCATFSNCRKYFLFLAQEFFLVYSRSSDDAEPKKVDILQDYILKFKFHWIRFYPLASKGE